MSTGTVELERQDRGVACLRLNRPEKGNCYDEIMLTTLARHLATMEHDPSVRVLVLRGNGRHFCTGADIEYVRHQKEAKLTAVLGEVSLDDVLKLLDTFPKPTIAAVHGACLGGGLGFAVCCDAVLAADSAFFGVPEIRLGFVPTTLLPYFIRAFGIRNLRRYGLSGERIPAELALRLEIVHDLSNAADFEQRLTGLLDQMFHGAPRAASCLKATLRGEDPIVSDPAADALELAEGMASVRERRPPNWYGG